MAHSSDDVTSPRPLAPGETATVTLTIPCSPEYVGTARLAILGIASRMGFSYDQIEDIRLAVGEACANAIERSNQNRAIDSGASITIRCLIEASKLTIEVEDSGPFGEGLDTSRPAGTVVDMTGQELGALLMEILVDQVSVESVGGGTRVRLVKFTGDEIPAA